MKKGRLPLAFKIIIAFIGIFFVGIVIAGVVGAINDGFEVSERRQSEDQTPANAPVDDVKNTEIEQPDIKQSVPTVSNTQSVKSHIYDNPEIRDVVNGSRTDKIGEYSILKVNSADVTEENLADWYFNYVVKNKYNWCMILYTDKTEDMGVYAINGMIEKNVKFTKDKYGDYMLGDTSKEIIYTPTNEQTLKEHK